MAGGISYPTSWTSIANAALGKIGTKLVENLTLDKSEEAKQCRLHIGQAVEEVLGSFSWTGVTKRSTLAPCSEVPPFGFSYYYQLPADCLRPISVDCGESPYKIEGDRVLTDASSVDLVYIYRPTDAIDIPAHIRNVIVLKLAFLITPALSDNEKTVSRVAAEYESALREARGSDGARVDTETAGLNGSAYYDESR